MSRGLSRGLSRGQIESLQEVDLSKNPVPDYMMPLASERTGFTFDKQPVLRFYISSGWPGKIVFTILENRNVEPFLETLIDGPKTEGIYEIDLKDYDLILKPDIEYEWFLAIILDPDERSADFLASATLQVVPPSDTFLNKTEQVSNDRLYFFYAQEGYWYNAIHHLSQMIDSHPDQTIFVEHRVQLLKQVHLQQVAAFDEKTRINKPL